MHPANQSCNMRRLHSVFLIATILSITTHMASNDSALYYVSQAADESHVRSAMRLRQLDKVTKLLLFFPRFTKQKF